MKSYLGNSPSRFDTQRLFDIDIAFVFGSIARQEEKADSDIDLMVIGDLGLRKLSALLSGVADKLGREINPHVLTAKEFKKRKERNEHFLSQVCEASKIFILGNEDELEEVAQRKEKAHNLVQS